MGLFDKLMGRELPERLDARSLYFRLLKQSREPAFFGPRRITDDYDGRIDVITLHMAVMLYRLRSEGEDGQLLSQALFDEMKDDFEIALREEGISDTGVKKRIKPMISHFYDRVKIYTDALDGETSHADIAEAMLARTDADSVGPFETKVAAYALRFLEMLRETDFKAITKSRVYFPDIS